MNRATRTETFDYSSREAMQESCANYIASRHSGYEFRAIRYEAVLEILKLLGLESGDSIIDVGGVDGEFGRYLTEQGVNVDYKIVDGMIDGTDLNDWIPKETPDFMVSIEVIEHLKAPQSFLEVLDNYSKKGVVLTTPNPIVVDVKAMDKTHISEVYPSDFLQKGYKVYPAILFFEEGDSLIGVKDKREYLGI